jgi:phosphotriesterase-related protein
MTNRRDFLKAAAASGIAAASLAPTGARSATDPVSPPRQIGMAQSVLGPISASRLGCTLPHEHIADGPHYLGQWPKAWGGRAEFVGKTVQKLKEARAAGIDTIVDLTTYDVWRDIRFLEEVSRKSGMVMIAATGQRFFPPQTPGVTMPARSIDGLAAFFMQEIERGIDGTGIRAGVIKIGIAGKEPTALEEIGMRAGARASKSTGVPIRIHARAADRAANSQVAILADEGVSPSRVSFDHSDDSGEIDYFMELAARGYSLGMDHVHRGLNPGTNPSLDKRADCIKLLAGAGYANRVFLSQDVELGGSVLPAESRDFRSKLDPQDGLLFTTRALIPRLRKLGVSPRDIHRMTVENARSFFAIV